MKNSASATTTSRVAVTGMGCITPAGNNVTALWDSLSTRRHAIRQRIPDGFPDAAVRCRWGSFIENDSVNEAWPGPDRCGGDRTSDLLTIAADQALRQAGIPAAPELGAGVGVIIGSGAGATEALFDAYHTFFAKGATRMRPTAVPRCMANSLSSRIAIRYGLTGPNYVVASACASSTVAIGTAFRMLRHGMAERMVCGGVETVFDPVTRSAWERLGVLSRRKDAAHAVLPYDQRRDGFVLGEGAGVLVLETVAAARRRGAVILGEIAGYGEASDATHLTLPDAAGEARSMTAALDNADIQPADIDAILGHGTATAASDRSESLAIKNVFGSATDRIPVLGLKALWGHLLGASGAVESIAGLQILRARQMPPDPIEERESDPECALRFGPNRATDAPLKYIMKNSFAFGGNNAVLIFRHSDLVSPRRSASRNP